MCKILSIESILSAYTHAHMCVRAHTHTHQEHSEPY